MLTEAQRNHNRRIRELRRVIFNPISEEELMEVRNIHNNTCNKVKDSLNVTYLESKDTEGNIVDAISISNIDTYFTINNKIFVIKDKKIYCSAYYFYRNTVFKIDLDKYLIYFVIEGLMQQGYRKSEIAKLLNRSQQFINYKNNELIDKIGLIEE